MKRFRYLACAALLALLVLAEPGPARAETDFAASVRLDYTSGTKKQAVTVKTFVDGDTTHFSVPESVDPSGVLKARYLACNTPESTGKIEEWGKAAARFTREKLENAEEIVIESDGGAWSTDSTGTRCLVWVWYRPAGQQDFRNLNIELLQEGYAIANSSAQNRYGDTCMAAIAQARELKKHVYSGEKDPDYYYGDAIELTIRELRLHPERYEGKKVAFSGVVTLNHDNAVFIEDYDEETGLYFGFSVYYGFNMSGGGLDVLSVGNEDRIVGTVQYYEAGETWQVSGLTYRMMKPDDPGNIRRLSAGHEAAWKRVTPEWLNGSVTLETEDGEETRACAETALGTSVSLTGLTVAETNGSFLRCESGGESVTVRLVFQPETAPLPGSTVDVRGIVGYYDGYCVCVYTQDGLTIR